MGRSAPLHAMPTGSLLLLLASCQVAFPYHSAKSNDGIGTVDGPDQRLDAVASESSSATLDQAGTRSDVRPCTWAVVSSNTVEDLRAVWVDPQTSAAWFVGGRGTILRCDRQRCSLSGSPTAKELSVLTLSEGSWRDFDQDHRGLIAKTPRKT